MSSKSPNQEVKELFFYLWKIFPNGLSKNKVEKIIVMGDVRKQLESQGFIYSEPHIEGEKEVTYYALGPNGVNLIVAWETQKLTRWAVVIAFISLFISLLSIAISIRII